MTNEKLMKIVQAVNDSKGEPLGLGATPKSTFISRAKEDSLHATNSIHAVHPHMDDRCWQSICTVEEFNQCMKEMSEGYKQKETKMKDNKHPHHDLIVEWAKDTSKEIQMDTATSHRDVTIEHVTNDSLGIYEFRFKPREFIKGHWYPCIDSSNDRAIYYYDGRLFCLVEYDSYERQEADSMKWIGESLGPIQFGEGK